MPPENCIFTGAPLKVYIGSKEIGVNLDKNMNVAISIPSTQKETRWRMIARAKKLSHPRHHKSLKGTMTFRLLNGDSAKVGMPCLD